VPLWEVGFMGGRSSTFLHRTDARNVGVVA
jgi:hypothetical protein